MLTELELLKDVIDAVEANIMTERTWRAIKNDVMGSITIFISDSVASEYASSWIEDASPKIESVDEVSKRIVSGDSQVLIAWDYVSLADAFADMVEKYYGKVEEIIIDYLVRTLYGICRHIMLLAALDFDTEMEDCGEIVSHCRFLLERVYKKISVGDEWRSSDDYFQSLLNAIRESLS